MFDLLPKKQSAVATRVSLGRLVNQSTMLLMFCIGSLILLLALLILFHQNATATKGYQLRTLERERSKLLLDEEILNMEISQAQSLGRLQSDKLIEKMIPVRNETYTKDDVSVASFQ